MLKSSQSFSAPLELLKNTGKTLNCSVPVLSVSFLKPVLQNPGCPRVFLISGQLLWSSVAPMQLGVWRRAALFFASRTENRVVFRVARVVKSLGIAFADLFILVECVGGRNRLTSSAIFDS
jgi:formate-dependent nitrite reductase membrane component NrfD